MVPHRSTNRARACLTSLSRREAVLSCWYGRSQCRLIFLHFYNDCILTYRISIILTLRTVQFGNWRMRMKRMSQPIGKKHTKVYLLFLDCKQLFVGLAQARSVILSRRIQALLGGEGGSLSATRRLNLCCVSCCSCHLTLHFLED